MTHIITHNSKHTAHIITHTLTHKKDHNSIDTPQNNPQKRRANHFAVFVPQPFRAVDKLAVGESHEVRGYSFCPRKIEQKTGDFAAVFVLDMTGFLQKPPQ